MQVVIVLYTKLELENFCSELHFGFLFFPNRYHGEKKNFSQLYIGHY